MKTEEEIKEIKEKLEIYKQLKNEADISTCGFDLVNGAITALEWVLKEGE